MPSSAPPRQFTMVPGQDIDPLFLCPICQDSWADPVELVPCGDIFCQACINAARAEHASQPMIMENFQCPQCHTVVQSEKKPNRMLLNTVLEVEVECRYCKWHGTREASTQHECEEGKAQKALEQSASPLPNVSGGAGGMKASSSSSSASSPLQSGNAPISSEGKAGAEMELSASSTAPSPSKAHAPRRAGSGTAPSPSEATPSSPPGLRGPRRAVQEIEGAFTAIEDDPTSTTFRTRMNVSTAVSGGGGGGGGGPSSSAAAATSSPANSYDYGFGNVRGSSAAEGGGGGGANAHHDQVLTSPLHPSGNSGNSPHTSSFGGPQTPASNLSGPSSVTNSTEPWRRYRLSQVEYDQLVGIFMMYDDGTGRLNHQQLRDLCFCMNFVQREDDATVIFRAMDTARKGYVSQDDFLLWLSTHRPDPSALFGLTQFEYTDAILQFRSVDPEFNGVIDANDFCALCLTNGYAHTPDEAMRYFHMCDDRHTGYVSLQQYLRNLKTVKSSGSGSSGGDGTGMPPRAPSQQQPSVGRVFGTTSPVAANTPLRIAGSSGSGGGATGGGGGGNSMNLNNTGHGSAGDGSFGSATPQLSDYWTNETAKAPSPPSQVYRQQQAASGAQQQQQQQQPYPPPQSGMFDFYPPAGPAMASPLQQQLQHQQQFQQSQQQVPPPPPQRFMTSLNSFPGDMQHQQQLQQQRQQAMQQQPYSQMGRSTMPAAAQAPSPQPGLSQQSKTNSSRSRLHRPSARPQRDEECVVM